MLLRPEITDKEYVEICQQFQSYRQDCDINGRISERQKFTLVRLSDTRETAFSSGEPYPSLFTQIESLSSTVALLMDKYDFLEQRVQRHEHRTEKPLNFKKS